MSKVAVFIDVLHRNERKYKGEHNTERAQNIAFLNRKKSKYNVYSMSHFTGRRTPGAK